MPYFNELLDVITVLLQGLPSEGLRRCARFGRIEIIQGIFSSPSLQQSQTMEESVISHHSSMFVIPFRLDSVRLLPLSSCAHQLCEGFGRDTSGISGL